jgi:hypothetical protein
MAPGFEVGPVNMNPLGNYLDKSRGLGDRQGPDGNGWP